MKEVFQSSRFASAILQRAGRFNASAVDQKRQSSTREARSRIELISLETRILLASHLQMIGRCSVCLRPLASWPALMCFRAVHKNVGRHTSEDLFAFYLILVKKSQP